MNVFYKWFREGFLMRNLRSSAAVVGFLFFLAPCSGAQTPVLLSPLGQGPALLATPEGYTAAWFDFRDAGPQKGYGGMRLAFFDPEGNRQGEDVLLDFQIPNFYADLSALVPVPGGYLLLAQEDAAWLYSLALDATGLPTGPGYEVIESWELYPFNAAAGSAGPLVTYAEWYGSWVNYSLRLTSGGTVAAPRQRIAAKQHRAGSEEVFSAFLFDSPLVWDGTGFLTAWVDFKAGVRSRNLTAQGVPEGTASLIEPPENCPGAVWPAAAEGTQYLLYSTGCDQHDLFFRARLRDGLWSPPFVLSAEPYDEGGELFFGDTIRPLQAFLLGSRLGVLYKTEIPGSESGWMFLEYDVARGHLLGRRTIPAVSGGAAYGLKLAADPWRERFLLTWSGFGTEGWGVYFSVLVPM